MCKGQWPGAPGLGHLCESGPFAHQNQEGCEGWWPQLRCALERNQPTRRHLQSQERRQSGIVYLQPRSPGL